MYPSILTFAPSYFPSSFLSYINSLLFPVFFFTSLRLSSLLLPSSPQFPSFLVFPTFHPSLNNCHFSISLHPSVHQSLPNLPCPPSPFSFTSTENSLYPSSPPSHLILLSLHGFLPLSSRLLHLSLHPSISLCSDFSTSPYGDCWDPVCSALQKPGLIHTTSVCVYVCVCVTCPVEALKFTCECVFVRERARDHHCPSPP